MDTKQIAVITARSLVTFKWQGRKGWRAYGPSGNKEILQPLLEAYGGRIDWVSGRYMWSAWGNTVKQLASDLKPYATRSQLVSLERGGVAEVEPPSSITLSKEGPSVYKEGCTMCKGEMEPYEVNGVMRPYCPECRTYSTVRVWGHGIRE